MARVARMALDLAIAGAHNIRPAVAKAWEYMKVEVVPPMTISFFAGPAGKSLEFTVRKFADGFIGALEAQARAMDAAVEQAKQKQIEAMKAAEAKVKAKAAEEAKKAEEAEKAKQDKLAEEAKKAEEKKAEAKKAEPKPAEKKAEVKKPKTKPPPEDPKKK